MTLILSFKLDSYPLEDVIEPDYFTEVIASAVQGVNAAETTFVNLSAVCEFLDCYDEGLLGYAKEAYDNYHALYLEGLAFVVGGFNSISPVSKSRLIANSRAAATLNNLYEVQNQSKPKTSVFLTEDARFSAYICEWDTSTLRAVEEFSGILN